MEIEPITGAGETTGGSPPPSEPAQPSGGAPAAGAPPAGSTEAPAKPARPDGYPEGLNSYWNDDKGVDFEKLSGRLGELEAASAEQVARDADVPAEAAGYKLELAEDFEWPEGVTPPEDGSSPINEDDPRVQALRQLAAETRMPQAQFSKLLGMGIKLDVAENGRMREAVAAEREKLGTKGEERITAVNQWLTAKIGSKAASLTNSLFAAHQIEAVEALIRATSGGIPGRPGAGRDGKPVELSDEEYERMSPTDRINYARQAHAKG